MLKKFGLVLSLIISSYAYSTTTIIDGTYMIPTEQELQNAQKERDASDNKAKAMFQQRIETADVQTLLNELSFKSQAAIQRLKDREIEIKEVEESLKTAIVEASNNHTKALQKKQEVEDKLDEQYALLKQARQALEEVADKQSTEYSDALAKVTQLEQKVQQWKTEIEQRLNATDQKKNLLIYDS